MISGLALSTLTDVNVWPQPPLQYSGTPFQTPRLIYGILGAELIRYNRYFCSFIRMFVCNRKPSYNLVCKKSMLKQDFVKTKLIEFVERIVPEFSREKPKTSVQLFARLEVIPWRFSVYENSVRIIYKSALSCYTLCIDFFLCLSTNMIGISTTRWQEFVQMLSSSKLLSKPVFPSSKWSMFLHLVVVRTFRSSWKARNETQRVILHRWVPAAHVLMEN